MPRSNMLLHGIIISQQDRHDDFPHLKGKKTVTEKLNSQQKSQSLESHLHFLCAFT